MFFLLFVFCVCSCKVDLLLQDDLAKSLWSEMVREVVVHVSRSPCTYLSGLQLLSELLPLPLPIPSPRNLTEQVGSSAPYPTPAPR